MNFPRFGVAALPLMAVFGCHTPNARRLPNAEHERYIVSCADVADCRWDADDACPRGWTLRRSEVRPNGTLGVAQQRGRTTIVRTRETSETTWIVDCTPGNGTPR